MATIQIDKRKLTVDLSADEAIYLAKRMPPEVFAMLEPGKNPTVEVVSDALSLLMEMPSVTPFPERPADEKPPVVIEPTIDQITTPAVAPVEQAEPAPEQVAEVAPAPVAKPAATTTIDPSVESQVA